jgi:glycosyltransferase involved in cell wall biosynthesis
LKYSVGHLYACDNGSPSKGIKGARLDYSPLSTKPESFGRTVLEALSMGVPVVGYAHGGVGEQLTRLYPQGCVPLGDLDGLVRQCRAALGLGRITLPSSPPTLEHMLADTLAVYEFFF